MEFPGASETDVTNLNRRELSRVRLPQGVAESRMRDCELTAKSVKVCHCGTASESGTTSTQQVKVLVKGVTAPYAQSHQITIANHECKFHRKITCTFQTRQQYDTLSIECRLGSREVSFFLRPAFFPTV